MRELVEFFIESLVDHPELVEIHEEPIDGGVCYRVRVAPGEGGKVIGQQGRIIQSIRTVLRAMAAREEKRVEVEVQD